MSNKFYDKNVLVFDEKIVNNSIKKRTSIGLKERKKILSNLKNNVYTHIRGYHGCRPKSIESYKTFGLRPLPDIIETRKQAMELFNVSETQIIELEMPINEYPIRKGRVFFLIYEHDLTKYCGHYLCYGSEYLLYIAACLDNSNEGFYHKKLLNTGTPTILGVDIPINLLSCSEKNNITCLLSEENSLENYGIEIVKKACSTKMYRPQTVDNWILKRRRLNIRRAGFARSR